MILGVAILTFCAQPLMTNVIQFSGAVGVPTFIISFVVLPIVINGRMAIAAIFPASQKSSRAASLTFSEVCSSTCPLSLNVIILWLCHALIFNYFFRNSIPTKMIWSFIIVDRLTTKKTPILLQIWNLGVQLFLIRYRCVELYMSSFFFFFSLIIV